MTWRDMGSKNYGANLTVISGPKHTGYTQVFFVSLFVWVFLDHMVLPGNRAS